MIKVRRTFHIQYGTAGRHEFVDRPVARIVPEGRVPRVSRLMALAIRFDGLIRRGEVSCQSALARRAGVTQPRMTQIMNLMLLAPDIQEQVLQLPRVTGRTEPVTERALRALSGVPDWAEQRRKWREIRGL
jgi:hypothetical protein